VITQDIPPGALGISRPEQQNVEGYAERTAREASSQEGDEADPGDT
jgi:bifunctional N-acetylglucosamine-1-phosphate-uridyltransferase/glucosamine-1-phosphate-acetyltransferase GlmU-like protein